MTLNLRVIAEEQLAVSLEGVWGLPVELISPDGIRINTSQLDGSQLKGQILYDTIKINPDTGMDMIVNNPVVTLRRNSLIRIPKAGEDWAVRIPIKPDPDAELVNFVLDKNRPPQGGSSIGFIRLYLIKAKQV